MFRTKSGFTIVELLIVIVVIGILAAITIVAYNGIQQRARVSSISAALSQAAKKLAVEKVNNSDVYPSTLASAGVTDSQDMSYQYRLTSTGYCVTATNGSLSYNITESSSPSEGSCIGHASGGGTLATNLVTNPSFETNTTGWTTIAGGSIVRVASGSGIVVGNNALEVVAASGNQSGVGYSHSGLAPSTTYTFSVYITAVSGDFSNLGIRVGDGAGTRASTTFSPLLTPGQTVRKTLTWTSSTSSASTSVTVWRNAAATSSAIFRIDAAMIETGSTATGYSE